MPNGNNFLKISPSVWRLMTTTAAATLATAVTLYIALTKTKTVYTFRRRMNIKPAKVPNPIKVIEAGSGTA